MATVKTTFNFDTKKLVLDDEQDYSSVSYPSGASAIGVNYHIVSPTGTVIHNNSSTTDLDCYPLEETEYGETSLQVDAGGDIVQGEYRINKNIFYVDGDGDVVSFWESESYKVYLDFTAPTPVVTPEIDYYSPLLSATDDTNYTFGGSNPISISRTLSIIHPSLDPPVSPVTTTGSTVSTSTFYGTEDGLQYTFKLESELEYLIPANSPYARHYIVVTIEETEREMITVPDHVCKVHCVLAALQKRYAAAKCSNQTNVNAAMYPFLLASAYAQLMVNAYKCGKISSVEAYKDKIFDLGNAEDGCCCGGDDEPQLVVGLGGSGSSVTIEGGSGITITVSGDTYTINLSDEILELIYALNYNVISSDGSIAVTTSTEDGVTTFDLSVASGGAGSRLDIMANFAFSAIAPPTVEIKYQTLSGSVFQEVTQDSPNTFLNLVADDTDEYLNMPVEYTLDNFFSGDNIDFYISAAVVGNRSLPADSQGWNIPITAEVIWIGVEAENPTIERIPSIRFRHADGSLVTGIWMAEMVSTTAYLDVKITLTT